MRTLFVFVTLLFKAGADVSAGVVAPRLNDPPEVIFVELDPNTVPADGITPFSLTVTVNDPDGLLDISRVSANLSAFGSSADTALYDEGLGVFTLDNIKVPAGTTPGIKTIYVQAIDYGGLLDMDSVQLTVTEQPFAPVIHWIVVKPDSVIENRSLVFAVRARVTDENGQNTIGSVTVDMTSAGLSVENLLDNGTYGDSASGDSIYTRIFENTFSNPGACIFTVTALDNDNLKDSGDVLFYVWPNYEPFIQYAVSSPASVPADGSTAFVLTVSVSDDNGRSDIESVTADFSAIGGAGNTELWDDGTNGDTTAFDGVYTVANQTVAEGTEPPTQIITITATDKGGLYQEYPATLNITDPNDIFDNLQTPKRFALFQNYPNPFNPTTQIRWNLPVRAMTTVKIYNILGQEIRTLISQSLSAGQHRALWDGKDHTGLLVSSGVYICRIEAVPVVSSGNYSKFVKSLKMMLLK